MKTFLILLLTCGIAWSASAQAWTRYSVGNGISTLFPSQPKYEAKAQQGQNVGTYVSKTDNCLFIAMVLFQAIPRYANFVKLKQSDQTKFIGQFLDNYIKGKLSYTNADSRAKIFSVGKYQGREAEYIAVNPASGKESKRFTKAIMVNDRLISFECWNLADGIEAENEKVKFFTSIAAK